MKQANLPVLTCTVEINEISLSKKKKKKKSENYAWEEKKWEKVFWPHVMEKCACKTGLLK